MSNIRPPDSVDSSSSPLSLDKLSISTQSSCTDTDPSVPPSPSLRSEDVTPTRSGSLFLPPELLREIFSAIPLHPSSERNSTLSALCLADQAFLAIARPLLYEDIRLDLNSRYWLSDSSDCRPINTLVENEECANLVKSVRVRYRQADRDDIVTLAYVLSRLKNVESVKPAKGQFPEHPGFVADFLLAIARHCPKLRHLELPEPSISGPCRYDILFSAFPCLESFTGHLSAKRLKLRSGSPPQPSFHLKGLFLHSPSKTSTISRLVSASHESLVTLSLHLHGSAQLLDFSSLVNLSTLHLHSSSNRFGPDENGDEVFTSLGQPEEQSRLRKILETTRDLPITEFSLKVQVVDIEVRESRVDQIDAIVFWTRDVQRPALSLRRPSVSPLPSSTTKYPWFDLRQEACRIIEKGGLAAVQAMEKYGITIGYCGTGWIERCAGERNEDTETEEEEESESDDEFYDDDDYDEFSDEDRDGDTIEDSEEEQESEEESEEESESDESD